MTMSRLLFTCVEIRFDLVSAANALLAMTVGMLRIGLALLRMRVLLGLVLTMLVIRNFGGATILLLWTSWQALALGLVMTLSRVFDGVSEGMLG